MRGAGAPLLDADRQFTVDGLFAGAVGYYTSIDAEPVTAAAAAEATS
jgi:hypothetical protein